MLSDLAVNDMEDETGTEVGRCPFVVHGLTEEEYSTKGLKALKAIALKHLTDNKKLQQLDIIKIESQFITIHSFSLK